MKPEIQKKRRIYDIGEKVWHANCGVQSVSKPCPVCFGKLKVTLILGNDEQVTLPCDFCSHGYLPPTGIKEEWEYVSTPRLVIITSRDIKSDSTGKIATYSSGRYYYDADVLFDTEKEALAECDKRRKEKEHAEVSKAKFVKANSNKRYSWNAGYHRREANRLRKDAERHDKLASICRSRAQETEKGEL